MQSCFFSRSWLTYMSTPSWKIHSVPSNPQPATVLYHKEQCPLLLMSCIYARNCSSNLLPCPSSNKNRVTPSVQLNCMYLSRCSSISLSSTDIIDLFSLQYTKQGHGFTFRKASWTKRKLFVIAIATISQIFFWQVVIHRKGINPCHPLCLQHFGSNDYTTTHCLPCIYTSEYIFSKVPGFVQSLRWLPNTPPSLSVRYGYVGTWILASTLVRAWLCFLLCFHFCVLGCALLSTPCTLFPFLCQQWVSLLVPAPLMELSAA